jgi:sugar phosphate isomerase/epimerase
VAALGRSAAARSVQANANIHHNAPIEYLYILKERLCHLHLHDNMGGNSEKYHDTHSAPGNGSVNWLAFANGLNQIRFRGTATYECEPNDNWLKFWC